MRLLASGLLTAFEGLLRCIGIYDFGFGAWVCGIGVQGSQAIRRYTM